MIIELVQQVMADPPRPTWWTVVLAFLLGVGLMWMVGAVLLWPKDHGERPRPGQRPDQTPPRYVGAGGRRDLRAPEGASGVSRPVREHLPDCCAPRRPCICSAYRLPSD